MFEYMNKIQVMCESLNYAEGKLSDEFLFTIHMADLFYYKNNIGVMDIKAGFVDGRSDGGIDFIFANQETMYLLQGKTSSNLSVEDIKNVFYKMIETVRNFNSKKTEKYSALLKSSYLNAYDDLNDDKNIELVLFTNTEVNKNMKDELDKFREMDICNDFTISVYDCNFIEEKKSLSYSDSDLVEEDSVALFLNEENQHNMLAYGEGGIIVNIKATSLNKLYQKYGVGSLFSYNLREHINQKNVDDAIDATIKSEPDKFWYYNNGITIGCGDFRKDGNRIKLYDFSIINGAQTTTKIGKSKLVSEKNDFAIVCKIVRAQASSDEEERFITKISEASNSQKPIKQRDLKANAKEQKILQANCAKNGKHSLAVEIKRGVKPKNHNKVEKWQRVTNEYIGQLIYACILQKPGVARNSKNTMFSSRKIYKEIFLRKNDCDTLYDLVRIGDRYQEFVTEYILKSNDLEAIGVAKNGKLVVMAVLIYLYKKSLGIVDKDSQEEIWKDNISGLLITDYPYDDLDTKLDALFEYIIRKLKSIYEVKKETFKITSYSNFFKSEPIYELILSEFDNIDKWDSDKLADYMNIFILKK